MKETKKVFIAIFFAILMLAVAFSVVGVNLSSTAIRSTPASQGTHVTASNTGKYVPWIKPTNTSEEPGYTGGTYTVALAGPPGDLNPFTSITAIDGCVFGEVYNSLYQTYLNGTTGPFLATGYSLSKVPTTSNHTTFDLETGHYAKYSAIYTIHLRSGVRWTNWSPNNASQTYVFSNVTNYNNDTGAPMSHTFKKYKTTTMLKYELQAGDVVCTWRLSSTYGAYPGIVNAVPVNNLTVDFYVTTPNLLIVCDDFTHDIYSYNVWSHHNYSSTAGYFNYEPSKINSTSGYNTWNMNWNLVTGSASGLVGTGPFMVTNGFGVTQGVVIPNHVIKEYANPYFFTQYANLSSGLRQWTPKIHELEFKEFISIASMALADESGQIDGMGGIGDCYVPQLDTTPNMQVRTASASTFNMLDINTHIAPFNVTNFRVALNYATPKGYIASVLCHGNTPGQTWAVPANSLFYNSSVPSYSFSLAKASSLLNNTPGFSKVNGKLEYNGTQVSITILILSSAIAAEDDLGMYVIQSDWQSLGISVHLNLVSVPTMFAKLGAVQSGASKNSFQIENFCDGTGIGDPALCCEIRYNSSIGPKACSYVGPFSSLNYSGHHYTGKQVDHLMNNLTNEALNTNNIVKAEKLVKEMQGIEVMESIIIPLGYATNHIPLLLTYFHNQSALGHGFCYWNRLSVELRSTPLTVAKVTQLQTSASITQNAYNGGEYGNITIVVTSDNKTMSGVNVTIGYVAPYAGILNVTSDNLVTNSKGVAVFEFYITSTLKNLLSLASQTSEVINFTIIATEFNHKVTPAAVVATGTSYVNIMATSSNVTSTTPPVSAISTTSSSFVFEVGFIVAAVVAIIGVGGLIYFRFKRPKT
jgi:hypothetical protein